jgi:uncharacterized membrane protein HdeD (DUF308 family)
MSSTHHEQEAPGGTSAQPGDASQQYAPGQGQHERPGPTGAALGLTVMAAMLMILSGLWDILEGIAAIARGTFFITLPHYAYNISVSGWGWFHLILGIVVFLGGVALFTDQMWARMLGTTLALISAVVNFLYIPYQPVWSIIVVAVNVSVIWALLTPRQRDHDRPGLEAAGLHGLTAGVTLPGRLAAGLPGAKCRDPVAGSLRRSAPCIRERGPSAGAARHRGQSAAKAPPLARP